MLKQQWERFLNHDPLVWLLTLNIVGWPLFLAMLVSRAVEKSACP